MKVWTRGRENEDAGECAWFSGSFSRVRGGWSSASRKLQAGPFPGSAMWEVGTSAGQPPSCLPVTCPAGSGVCSRAEVDGGLRVSFIWVLYCHVCSTGMTSVGAGRRPCLPSPPSVPIVCVHWRLCYQRDKACSCFPMGGEHGSGLIRVPCCALCSSKSRSHCPALPSWKDTLVRPMLGHQDPVTLTLQAAALLPPEFRSAPGGFSLVQSHQASSTS